MADEATMSNARRVAEIRPRDAVGQRRRDRVRGWGCAGSPAIEGLPCAPAREAQTRERARLMYCATYP